MPTLDCALIGNGTIGALVTQKAEVTWMCVPFFDGDPVFCSLLRGPAQPQHDGAFTVEMIGGSRSEQEYVPDTPIVVTRLFDAAGACVQVTDFAPRVNQGNNLSAPAMLVRTIECIAGAPAIRIRVRPMQNYGAELIAAERGTGDANDCLLYRGDEITLRLTTNASLDNVMNEMPFALGEPITLMLGPDEKITGDAARAAQNLATGTRAWWRDWVAALSTPSGWRDDVVRAAITLKLNVSEESGAAIAAMTTSIPEASGSERNWDYRYCWLRDAYFVVDALQRLGDSATTRRYVDFVLGIVESAGSAPLAPMFTIKGAPIPEEREEIHLAGYRGMGPVRVGNQAYHQVQHDAYGEAILAARPLFFDASMPHHEQVKLFNRLEPLGDHAANLFDKPDAGLWELRGIERVHTFSSVMCWAACDALASIAEQLDLGDRAAHWRARSQQMHAVIADRSWNARIGAFTAAMDGDTLDASLLLMHFLGFLAADDSRYIGTVRAIGRDLRRGQFIYRYVEQDDFGQPENAFLVCTFWYINALAAIGDDAEARELFDLVLSCRSSLGLLAEHVDPETFEQWGNFVQTYSMAGIIGSALRLSNPGC